jgi:hypothetical protein
LIPVSATGAFTLDMSKGSVQQVVCNASGAGVTLRTLNLQSGMEMTFIFVQETSPASACTVGYPSNMHATTNVSSTLGIVSSQKFVVSNHGSDLYATAAGTVTTFRE